MDKRESKYEMTRNEKMAHIKKVDLTNKTYDILSELISHQITVSDAIDEIYNYYFNNLKQKSK